MKPSTRALLMLTLALSMGARAQGLSPPPATSSEAPEDSWEAFPGAATPAPPPAGPRADGQRSEGTPRPTKGPWDDVSVFGARSLGSGRWAVSLHLGFPLAGIRTGVGLLPTLDTGLALDSTYGSMNDLRAFVKWQVLQLEAWAIALAAEGGPAFFSRRAEADERGARWLTGRRNWNLSPGVVAAYQENPKTTCFFADLRAHLALDTEPFQRDPLGGIPPAVQASGSYSIRFGAEAPLSQRTSYVVSLGLEVHGRPEDAPVTPVVLVGLVASL